MRPMRKRDWKASWPAALALVATASGIAMMFTAAAFVQPARGAPHGPPPEALAACKSLASGATCGFSGPMGTVAGTCFAPQQSMALACRPKDAPAPDAAASGPRR